MSSFMAASSEYLNELLSDKTTVAKMPKIFIHTERLLDQGMEGSYGFCGSQVNVIITVA